MFTVGIDEGVSFDESAPVVARRSPAGLPGDLRFPIGAHGALR